MKCLRYHTPSYVNGGACWVPQVSGSAEEQTITATKDETKEPTNERTDERTNRRMDVRTYEQTSERTNKQQEQMMRNEANRSERGMKRLTKLAKSSIGFNASSMVSKPARSISMNLFVVAM